MGRAALDYLRKRGAGSTGSEGSAGAHFVILSGEKRRMLKMAYLKYEN